MGNKTEIKDTTRYFIDVDLKTKTILDHGFGDKDMLINESPTHLDHHRIYISQDQYRQLDTKLAEFDN